MTDRNNFAAHIGYDDLREWLAAAERLGEVRHVKGASWQEDIGLAAEAILRAENGPCVVFAISERVSGMRASACELARPVSARGGPNRDTESRKPGRCRSP
jgi:hypothetical protein